jgi:signal transduction histidine kinase
MRRTFVRGIVGVSRDRLVALSRLVLLLAGFCAIYFEREISSPRSAYALLALYAVLALVCLATIGRPLKPYLVYLIHFLEIGMIAGLAAVTEGAASPFFVFFTFIMFVGTLRWDWLGALVTGGILCGVLFVMSAVSILTDTTPGEIDRIVLRNAWLVVGVILFIYIGAYRARDRDRLAELASWPAADIGQGELPDLEVFFNHAARAVGAARIVAIWEWPEEPYLYFARCVSSRCDYGQLPPGAFGDLILSDQAKGAFFWAKTRMGTRQDNAIGEELIRQFNIDRAIVAPFHLTICKGYCFFLDVDESSDDELRLSEIAAGRIGVELDLHRLSMRRMAEVGQEERAKLSRDLHDSVLQSLTAVAIKLETAAQGNPENSRELLLLRDTVATEHRRIRAFVTNPAGARKDEPFVSLLDEVRELAGEQEKLWHCAITVDVEPVSAEVTGSSYEQIRFILQESTANAVRHGGACKLNWAFKALPYELHLHIGNDGKQIPERYRNLASPKSINKRVVQLDGTFTISNTSHGVDLEISFPSGVSSMIWRTPPALS